MLDDPELAADWRRLVSVCGCYIYTCVREVPEYLHLKLFPSGSKLENNATCFFYGHIINKTVTRSAPRSLPCFLVQHCPSGKTETPENSSDAASDTRAFRFLFFILFYFNCFGGTVA